MPTRQECIDAAGRVLAEWNAEMATLTVEEHADRLMTPGADRDELIDRVRAHRGLPPLHAKSA